MLQIILQAAFLILVTFLSEIAAYRYVRNIDKNERKKLQEWELEYIHKTKKIVESRENV